MDLRMVGWRGIGLVLVVAACSAGDDGTSGSSSTSEASTGTSEGTGTTTGGATTSTSGGSTTAESTSTATGDSSSTGGPAVCGDGVVQAGEACDDGNADDTDACLGTCVAAACGDGVVQAGVEACDDGNADNSDVCLDTCVAASCGDGFVGPGEACDDANQVEDDACTSACALPSCGDGAVQVGEACDDGNADDADACLSTCLAASCGDPYVQAGVEACDDGNADDTDACLSTCEAASCGDGFVQAGVEACDDGNGLDDDGCQADCTLTKGASAVALGWYHTCALTSLGEVRCWGRNNYGQLGQGNTVQIGDDEAPSSIPAVNVGGSKVLAVTAGEWHTCVIVEGGKVRCWGRSNVGQLGLASTNTIGDNEQPWSVAEVPIGGPAKAIAAGRDHTCAVLEGGQVRCWGGNAGGQLGYGNVNTIGDNETPASAGDVAVGGPVGKITAGETFTCAVLETGKVRCWGVGTNGSLGYANTNNIGDDEAPDSVGPVVVGTDVAAIASGRRHTCAVGVDKTVRCWGLGSNGQLGLVGTATIGDNETPLQGGFVNIGSDKAIDVAAGYNFTCVAVEGGAVRCWGNSTYGQVGQGNTNQIGDNETPASIGPVDVGGAVTQLSANLYSVCTRGADFKVRCWGRSDFGQLGYANLNVIGDDEVPSAAGAVAFLP